MGRSPICISLLLVLAIGHQSSGSEEEASAPAQRTLVVFCAMGDVPQAPPLKVTVTDHASEPFVFDRRQIEKYPPRQKRSGCRKIENRGDQLPTE
ncbi:MAG: hypothetical protein VB835_16460 [Pirellulales bacterium]